MSGGNSRSGGQPPRAGSSQAGSSQAGSRWAGKLARTALALYPAAWRARYGDEVRVLLEDSGADLRTVASLAGQAVPAWIWPMRHLYDRPARMRASLATVLVAWTVLAGLALVFGQLAQAQPSLQSQLTGARQVVIQLSYGVFDAAVGVSVLAVVFGGLPLWLLMMRRARREQRPRDVACLLAPVVVPVVYLLAALVTASLVRQPGTSNGPMSPVAASTWPSFMDVSNANLGVPWYLVLVGGGFAAGLLSAAGPALALRRLRPRGPAVTLAVRAAGLAAGTMALAGAASAVAAIGLYRWVPPYHQGWSLAVYLPLVLLAVAVAVVSAARGIWAARSPAAA